MEKFIPYRSSAVGHILRANIFLSILLVVNINNLFAQCGAGSCPNGTTTITAANYTTQGITVNSGETRCLIVDGSFTLGGAIFVDKFGTLNICTTDPTYVVTIPTANLTLKSTTGGSNDWTNSAVNLNIYCNVSTDKIFFGDDAIVTVGSTGKLTLTGIASTSFAGKTVNNGTIVATSLPAGTTTLTFSAPVVNSGTIQSSADLTFSGTSLSSSSTGNLVTTSATSTIFFSTTVTNAGTVTGGGNVAVNGTFDNSGTITGQGNLTTNSSGVLTNSGSITINGSFNPNGSSSFYNNNYIYIKGSANFTGTYSNTKYFKVDGTLQLNKAGTIDVTGGLFDVKDLDIKAGALTTTGGGCAAFKVSGLSKLSSSATAVPSGSVGIYDTGNPGIIDHVVCSCNGIDADLTDNAISPPNPASTCSGKPSGGANTAAAGPYCGFIAISSLASAGVCFAALPVTLLSFKGKYLSDDNVELEWSTAREQNNSQFIIEKTEDLKTFTQIGVVKGAGNTSETTNYRYIDNQVGGSEIYYRLRQQDVNGSIQNLGIILPDRPDGEFIVEVFPNPNKGQFKIAAFGDYKIFHIHLLDHTGNLVYAVNDVTNNSEKIFEVTLEGLKGMYILEVGTDQEMFYNKIHIE